MSARLARSGHRVRVVAGGSASESAALARGLVPEVDALVVLGGDGLVHHVLDAVAGTGRPVGIVPAGTGNDTVTALGLPADPLAAVDAVTDALERGTTTAVDLGEATAADGTTTLFATVLCWGFDAAVAELGARLPWPPGPRRYDLAIAAHTVALRHRRLTLALDDAPAAELRVLLVAVGNGGWYGGGKRMVPQAVPDDGRLGIAVVGPVTRRTLARLAPTLPHAGHARHPAVAFAAATSVTLAATGGAGPPVAAWADGERVGALPLTVATRRGALTVLRPPWCVPPDASGAPSAGRLANAAGGA